MNVGTLKKGYGISLLGLELFGFYSLHDIEVDSSTFRRAWPSYVEHVGLLH